MIKKEDLARNLLAYGEEVASAQVPAMSTEDYQRVCEIGFRHALTGMNLIKAACLAAVEVLEGKPRELNRNRRIWTDAPEPCEPDPIHAAIAKRFEEYSGGKPLRKKEVVDGVSAALASVLVGFRYYRSKLQFRKLFIDGSSYVGLEYGHATLALRFGVYHRGVEEARARLFDSLLSSGVALSPTISKFSYNMGPNSPHWKHSVEATWPITGSEGLERASHEIVDFVNDVVLPYVTLHQDPAMIRDTLLTAPGHTDQRGAQEGTTVFAIDHLLGRRDWLEEDYHRLCEQHRAWISKITSLRATAPTPFFTKRPTQDPLDRLAQHYEIAAKKWDDSQ